MKVMVNLILGALLTLSAGAAFAAGDAGCGLGSVVISKNSKLLQLFAMTTNATSFSQGFGITSGTSGCSSSGIVKNDRQIDYFVEVNQDDLTREMAQGNGEKLTTLAALHGCQTKESQQMFSHWTQQSYDKILPTLETTSVELTKNLEKEFSQSSSVVQACKGASAGATVTAL